MLQLDTTSYWMASTPLPAYPSLDRDIDVDVAIIGGGITGITAAYLLKRAGKTVALIDRRSFASVDTGHTTAHLTYVTDMRLVDLEKNFGRDHAAAVWDAGRAALWQIEKIIGDEQIDCEFDWVTGYLHLPVDAAARSDADARSLQNEAELASALGFDARFVDRVPLTDRPGVEFEGQALFHPRKYLRGLVERIPGDGSHVCANTASNEILDHPLAVVTEKGHRIRCGYVVLATHNPLIGKSGMLSASILQTKLALYTSYAVAGEIPRGVAPIGSFWDTADPYLYLRIDHQNGHDFAILGGEDHKTGQAADPTQCYARLERRLKALIPTIELSHRWSGQVIETNDGLPFIGETSERQFVATGYSGNGMTFGTLAAIMACDTVSGRANPWKELFDPGRTKIRGGLWDYLRENKDYPYYLVRDRFAGAEGRTLRSLRRGEGKILQLEGKRVAAYRNEAGAVTLLSPVCTHLGCLVGWNTAERTWDCPCHGSRFEPTGQVLAGPAESPLKPASD
jgi:glycine/D-amino acid oxidase-like deaminating enzyme/nitrite reductase/ring-hydroxylating ferredoxin subunit